MKYVINIICTCAFIVLSTASAWAQFSNQGVRINEVYKSIPQEGLYIHSNNGLLFAGEKLYYKVYCLNLQDQRLSSLSKIAYVQLLDRDGNAVFSHKIRLSGGTGYADFSIPSDVDTGSYKLLAYTQWMQSRKNQPYFEADLLIINPYRKTPETYLPANIADSIPADSLPAVIRPTQAQIQRKINHGDHLVSLETDSKTYGERQAAELQINGLNPSVLGGSYSVSIKKIDKSLPTVSAAPINFWRDKKTLSASSGPGVLPELRGELFSGRVVDPQVQNGVQDQKVILSVPGNNYVLDVALTNGEGRFFFNMDSYAASGQAVLQLLEPASETYEIQLDPVPAPEITDLDYPSFTIDKSMEAAILQRSIHNQIENAYGVVKSDTVLSHNGQLPFYREFQQRFLLDDYTRFNTLRETMVEIVDNAWIDENGSDQPTFGVRPLDGFLESTSLLPAVVVDGLFIRDHKDFVDYNSKLIRSISLSRERVMLGPQQFQGLLSIQTNTGEFAESFYRRHLQQVELKRPESLKKYFFQNHQAGITDKRVPDLRYQLYWAPDLTLTDRQMKIRFYTSDIKGKFEIELCGFDQQGNPVSVSSTFTVE